MLGNFGRDLFSTDKSVDRPGTLDPLWTDGGADRGGAKGREEHGELGSGLTGARAAA
jgi:hypothetical protein